MRLTPFDAGKPDPTRGIGGISPRNSGGFVPSDGVHGRERGDCSHRVTVYPDGSVCKPRYESSPRRGRLFFSLECSLASSEFQGGEGFVGLRGSGRRRSGRGIIDRRSSGSDGSFCGLSFGSLFAGKFQRAFPAGRFCGGGFGGSRGGSLGGGLFAGEFQGAFSCGGFGSGGTGSFRGGLFASQLQRAFRTTRF